MKVKNGIRPVVPVKTKGDIPKGKIADCMEALKRAEAEAPVRIGDILLKNVAGTGVDIVATKSIGKEKTD